MHLHKMSKKVKQELIKKSKTSGLSQWFIVEKLLEGSLFNKDFDPAKWLKEL